MVVYDHVLGGSGRRMKRPAVNVEGTKVSHNPLLLLKANVTEILVTKDKCTSLSSIQGKLVESLRAQLGQLDAADLSSNVRGQIQDLGSAGQEALQFWISTVALVIVLVIE